jgi:dihydrofolate reductase
MIVACDQGNAIGHSDGRLPWHIKEDLARFKALTTGSTVVMGHNTYVSLNRPKGLPNRRNVVLSRKPYSEIRSEIDFDVEVISSLDWVLQHNEAAKRTVAGTDREPSDIWIIGGASVYGEAIARRIVDEIHMTLVYTTSSAEVRLPFDLAAWKKFILEQRKLGVNWEREYVCEPETESGQRIAFMTFKRYP